MNKDIAVQKLKKKALHFMESSGFPIQEEVLIEIDEKLPFMGYTSEREGKTFIVVSGWSLESEMSMGLVIHELSHVYRIETNHPSHNFSLQNNVIENVFKGTRIAPYQQKILQSIINNIQDLYADDISFEVYIKKSQKSQLNEFFLGWIHPPLPTITTPEEKWKSAELLLSASFAQANLERHSVSDTGNKVETAVQEFLEHTDKKQARKFTFFKNMMVHFPEQVTNSEFEKILFTYLNEFLKLVN